MSVSAFSSCKQFKVTHISELGFFFFLRMAVAVSSTCGGLVRSISVLPEVEFTSLASPPAGSLQYVSNLMPQIKLMAR